MSCGKVFKTVVYDMNIFLLQKDKSPGFADVFCNDKWLSAVCYLVDIFKNICTHNLSLQGKGDVLTGGDTVTTFCKKVMLLREHFENSYLEMFPSLCNLLPKIMRVSHMKNCQICTHKLTKKIS